MVAQDHDWLPARRAVLFSCERATADGVDAERRKEVVRNKLSRDHLRFYPGSLASQQKPLLGAGDQAREDLHLLAEEDVIGERERPKAFFRPQVFQFDYRVRGLDRQWTQILVDTGK